MGGHAPSSLDPLDSLPSSSCPFHKRNTTLVAATSAYLHSHCHSRNNNVKCFCVMSIDMQEQGTFLDSTINNIPPIL